MAVAKRAPDKFRSLSPRPGQLVIAILTILSLLPITWALAFPEPNNRALCPPDREAPPRLAPESEIQAPASSTTPTVQILNPLSGAKVSDKYDGTDRRYHITAVAVGVPSEAVLEAVIQRGLNSEVVLGTLCPVEGTRDTFEGFWDIPDAFPEGTADFIVNAFDRAGDGAQVIATDKVAITVQHLGGAASDDVRLLWPPNDGPLGFFRNKAGEWRLSIQARTSTASGTPAIRYSTSPLGAEPAYRECATLRNTFVNRASDTTTLFEFSCRLAAGDRPSAVTGIAAIAQTGTESSDAHRVHPFLQKSSDMKVNLEGIFKALSVQQQLSPPANYPSNRRRLAGAECLQFVAIVTDQFARPVSGANVDVELRGPTETASFGPAVTGSGTTGTQNGAGAASAPDRASATEPTVNCSGQQALGPTDLKQGRTVVADGPDAKAIESVDGTNDAGRWGFQIYSAEPGFSKLRAWVDEEPLASETSDRVPDDDRFTDGEEAAGVSQAQWLEGPLQLDITPRDEFVSIGTCRIYRVEAVAGRAPISGFNIDLHIRIPDPTLKLCGGGEEILTFADSNHPDGHTHAPAPQGATGAVATICPTGAYPCHHLEGTTDEEGQLVFGLTSSIAGRSSVLAWADGEPGQDNDLQSSKPAFTLVTEWVDGSLDSSIRLLAPSDDLAATGNGLQKVSADSFRIVGRVGSPDAVKRVTIEVSRAPSVDRVVVGEATRIGNSNFYEFVWDLNRALSSYQSGDPSESPSPSPSGSPSPSVPVGAPVKPGVPDGTYTITARVDNTRSDSHALEVNRSLNPPDDTAAPLESATITSPKNGGVLGFVDGTTKISGVATAGAEGVDIFYTTVGLTEKPVWNRCGHRLFPGTATGPQAFTDGMCSLVGAGKPAKVTGLAVVPFNCNIPTPGCANPSPAPIGGISGAALPRGNQGALGAGDTIAVIGCEGSPCLVMRPSDWNATIESCVPLSVHVAQQAQPAKNQRVGLEFRGPSDRIRFCDPIELDDAWLGSPEFVEADPFGPDLHSIAGLTDDSGEFHFGVRSEDSNFASIFSAVEGASSIVTAWLDDGDLDREEGEQAATSAIHWLLPDRCTVVGTDRADELVGTLGHDKICGLGGDDIIYGLEGNDVVLGGDGNDRIFGQEGRDLLFGESGDDSLIGGPGNDGLDGGPGEDRCNPGAGKKNDVSNCETVIEPKRKRPHNAI